jgi:hypothetical protein
MNINALIRIVQSPNLATQQRIKTLSGFSYDCTKDGIHVAQGLRIIRRDYHIRRIKVTRAASPLEYLNTLLKPQPTTVVTANTRYLPEHFLLTTILPPTLNRLTGYVSPVLDIQPDIHFIRTQRRYNKRRYARVRVASRPSF